MFDGVEGVGVGGGGQFLTAAKNLKWLSEMQTDGVLQDLKWRLGQITTT